MSDPKNAYVWNDEFIIPDGNIYFKDGNLDFPPGERKDGFYRTRFGPMVGHSGEVCGAEDINQNLGLRRLTGKRAPEQPGFHELLCENQSRWFIRNKPFFREVGKLYEPHMQSYTCSEEECEEHYADTHKKQRLRIEAFRELLNSGELSKAKSLWVKKILWKMKRAETKKFGKKTRMIGDLGVGASLRGFRLTNALKVAQATERVYYKGGEIMFCKSPDPVALSEAFDKLINPPGRFFFVYFSDDSCLSIRRGDKIDRYNLDISSCDASHGPEIFKTLVDIVPERMRADMQILVDQCKLPAHIQSFQDRRKKVKLIPRRPLLFSGSTITTAINNIANLAIAKSIADCDYRGEADVMFAAQDVGYIVSGCKPLEFIEDLQFLKNSPVLDTQGNWKPMLNLGVLLRASGTCEGDLNGRGDLRERAREFQRGLLHGAYPFTNFQMLDNMKMAMGEGKLSQQAMDQFEYKVVKNDSYPPYRCDEDSLYRRYRLTPLEVAELLEFSKSDVFTEFSSGGASKILKTDYSLTTLDHVGREVF